MANKRLEFSFYAAYHPLRIAHLRAAVVFVVVLPSAAASA